MGPETAGRLFSAHALSEGLNLVEGNRGLFDGFDEFGTHSTAELAKLLQAPVLLVVDATKATRTVAALVLGCQTLDPEVDIRGVILNRVGGSRHESIVKKSIESLCCVPVLGVLPKIDDSLLLPTRHLGLVTTEEHSQISGLSNRLLSLASRLDTLRIQEIARRAPALENFAQSPTPVEDGSGLKIAYLKDSAFTFYYPDNLEALERSGARLEPVAALSSSSLPEDLDALYMGGGFPETHTAILAANKPLHASIRQRVLQGLPIYAECGGLMFLAQAIRWRDESFPMAGVLPFQVEVSSDPQGHGYIELLVDTPNPFYSLNTRIRGHEFHYSSIIPSPRLPATSCAVQRGVGAFGGRDGVLVEKVWASYTHVHAVATPEWARGLLGAARAYAARRRDSPSQVSPSP
jgi:cobyrinic acid a,c-diamide synthase